MNTVHQTLRTEHLTQNAFAEFGDVLDASGEADIVINQGNCGRYHDRAQPDILNGRAGISVFKANPRSLPHLLDMVERHPEGSQAFLPMSLDPFLVIVAPDEDNKPGTPRAFITEPGQGVNIHRNIWHGVLTPLSEPGLFAVVDRIGEGTNLQEHWFEKPWLIER